MRIFLASIAITGAAAALWGCGSDSFSIGTGGGGSNAAGGGAQGGSEAAGGSNANGGSAGTGGSNASGGGNATGGNGSGGNAGTGGSNGSGGNQGSGGNAPACPDPSGYYGKITTEGLGCGDVDTDAGVCIGPGITACSYTLNSGIISANGAIRGSIHLRDDGTFDGAAIDEGGMMRTGCKGKDSGDVLTIICGGDDESSSQHCKITLKRTDDTCPPIPNN